VLGAEVLGVDRSTDLAVLRVSGPNLPQPLQVTSAKDLVETQDVFVFGFPFGSDLGRNITVSKSSVSSLRKDAGGILHQVQVNGGMHPGNSGGPVVDAEGHVVGVAVSQVRNSQINFAVPGDYVHVILNGRIASMELGQPYREGESVKVPVKLEFLDPLLRIQKATLDYWTGNPGKPRPAGQNRPHALAGDAPPQELLLEYKQGKAQGELTLPKVEAGKVIWIQPAFVNGAGQSRWASATVYQPAPPLERKPAKLAYQHHPGKSTNLELSSQATLKLRDDEGVDHALALQAKASLQETTEPELDADGTASVHLQFKKFSMGITLDNRPLPRSERLQRVAGDVRFLVLDLRVDRTGKPVSHEVSITEDPRGTREELKEISAQFIQSLEAVALPLPNRIVETNKPWQIERTLTISAIGPEEAARADITYTYLGTRYRAGRAEAVLASAGRVRGAKGKGANLGGRVSGTSIVDLATGVVVSAQTSIDLDLDVTGNRLLKASGILEVRLQRSLPQAVKEN
jgi:hypothetical protein